MRKMDSWCKPTVAKSGARVSGGAARNVRIAARGGMDDIIADEVEIAVRSALKRAEEAVARSNLPPRVPRITRTIQAQSTQLKH